MGFVYHQIFCDESGKYHSDPLIAFSGVCSTGDRLRSFDEAWRVLLRSYELDSLHMERVTRLVESHGYRFQKGQTIDERTELLFPFADCINKHLEKGFIQAWDVKGFNNLTWDAHKLLGGSHDPYFLAFVLGLADIVKRLDEDDRISIICDDDQYTAWDCYLHYRAAGKTETIIQKKAISISFANDKHFPALQAADMVAFLTRYEALEQFQGVANIWRRLYDRLITEPEPAYGIMRWFKMYADEQKLVDFANKMKVVVEQKKNEKIQKKQNAIRKLPEHTTSIAQSTAQRDQGGAGKGKGRKKGKKA
jgi:hypothetical protein